MEEDDQINDVPSLSAYEEVEHSRAHIYNDFQIKSTFFRKLCNE